MTKNEENELLKACYECVSRLMAVSNRFIYNIKRKDYGRALAEFFHFPADLEWFLNALTSLNNSGALKFTDETRENIKDVFNMFNEAVRSVDYLAMRDAIEFEFLPVLRDQGEVVMVALGVTPHDPIFEFNYKRD